MEQKQKNEGAEKRSRTGKEAGRKWKEGGEEEKKRRGRREGEEEKKRRREEEEERRRKEEKKKRKRRKRREPQRAKMGKKRGEAVPGERGGLGGQKSACGGSAGTRGVQEF